MSGHLNRRDRFLGPQLCPRRGVVAGFTLAGLLAAAGTARRAASQEQDRLRIGGTGMALASMRKIGDAFVAGEPGVHLEVLPSLGTGGGLSAVAAGAIDLALAARPLNDSERAKGLLSAPYARTPIAFVTQFATPVDRVTLEDLAPIFSGSINVWPDGVPIRLVRREPSDADWSMLRALSPEMAKAVEVALQRPGLLTVATDQDNADALERIHGSFGVMSIGQLRSEDRHLKPLVLDGVMPGTEELAGGRYKLSRPLYVVWKQQPRQALTRFLAFLGTEPAHALLFQLGHIPLSDAHA